MRSKAGFSPKPRPRGGRIAKCARSRSVKYCSQSRCAMKHLLAKLPTDLFRLPNCFAPLLHYRAANCLGLRDNVWVQIVQGNKTQNFRNSGIPETSNFFRFALSSSNDLNGWNGAQRWNVLNGPRYQALEILCRTPDRAPHVRDRAVVEAQALVRLPEVTTDNVNEGFPAHHRVGVEGVDVVDGNHARSHVPLVIPGALVRFLDVVVGLVVRPEMLDVHFRIRVTD